MAKKLVQNITAREEDFAQWYTDVVREAKLCDYSGVKGCMNYLPNGYALWENIQKNLDARFKETGVDHSFVPESSCGRKDIQSMQHTKKQKSVQNRCGESTETLHRMFLQSR